MTFLNEEPMRYIALIAGLLIGMIASPAFGQGCYGGSYQAQDNSFSLAAAAPQTYTVHVPVQVTVQAQPVAVAAPQAVAAPMCQQSVGFAAPSCAMSYAAPVAVPFAVAMPSYSVVSCGVGFARVGVASHGYRQSFGQVGFVGAQQFGAIGGQGVSVSAVDRRGTRVVANGVNNVRIQRGLLGRINGATADANRGLFGRISPF